MGYALSCPVRKGKSLFISNEHAYSADEIGKLPFHPVIGDKFAKMQPVAVKDIASAVCNSIEFTGKKTIFAVGPNSMSQEAFFKFFVDHLGKRHRPLTIPLEAAAILTKHASKGHFAEYVVDYCAQGGFELDYKPFEERVGRPLASMEEIYEVTEGEKLIVKYPPIREHATEVFKKIIDNPGVLKDLTRAMKLIIKANV